MIRTKCDLCGDQNNYKELGIVGNNTLVKCLVCGHIYMLLRPCQDELLKIYTDNYFKDGYIKGNEKVHDDYINDKPNILKFVKKRFETIHKYKSPGIILDIGCAAGFYLEHAAALGWVIYGIELSEFAYKYAKSLLNTNQIYNTSIEEAEFEKSTFDVVTMWLVLEHLSNPVEILKKVALWLKPGGILGIKVPNADGLTFRSNIKKWISQHPEDHMCDFTPDTLQRLAYKAGFELLEYETEGIYLDRVEGAEEFKTNEGYNKFYNLIAKRADLGDSLVMFFRV